MEYKHDIVASLALATAGDPIHRHEWSQPQVAEPCACGRSDGNSTTIQSMCGFNQQS